MFSDIKNTPERVRMWLWESSSIKVVLKEINYAEKNTIKVLHFLHACPFYKAAGQEINVIRGQKVENVVNGISNHTDKITKQLERSQPSLFLKEIYE